MTGNQVDMLARIIAFFVVVFIYGVSLALAAAPIVLLIKWLT